jgi:hypothetical protein
MIHTLLLAPEDCLKPICIFAQIVQQSGQVRTLTLAEFPRQFAGKSRDLLQMAG